MEYESSIFNGVREILDEWNRQSPRLVAWFAGILGASEIGQGVDSVQAFNDFNGFCTDTLGRGPVREKDVEAINQMIFIQWKSRSGLNEYDARTGMTWEWDGSPLVHVVAEGLCANAARHLDSDSLLGQCRALQAAGLERYAEVRTPTGTPLPWADLALERAAHLKRQFDVPGILADLEALTDAKTVHRG